LAASWRNLSHLCRSFLDMNGDGVRDLKGVQRRLDYPACLCVDAIHAPAIVLTISTTSATVCGFSSLALEEVKFRFRGYQCSLAKFARVDE
jgi:hypothetical protein